MELIKRMFEDFKLIYAETPLYGQYSRILKRRVDGRQQVLSAFIDNLQMQKVGQDEEVKKYIDTILSDLAKLG